MKLAFGLEALFLPTFLLMPSLGNATNLRRILFLMFLLPPTYLGLAPYMEMPQVANFRHILL